MSGAVPPPGDPQEQWPAATPPPGYVPPPGYGAPPPGYAGLPAPAPPAPPAPPTRGSGLATASLILGILGLLLAFCLFFLPILPVLAIILGHIGLAQIRREGLSGRGMAVAGVTLGYVALFVSVLVIVFVAVGSFTSPTPIF